jgi:hypothetical protein
MNIDKIIRKMLLEDDKQDIRGFDFNDQYDILEKGKLYCSDLKARAGNKNVKRMESKDIAKFPGLVGNSEIAYLTSDKLKNGSMIMFFAIQDPNSKGERTFYTYNVLPGIAPKQYEIGWGKGCPQMQETSELGKDTLSPEQKSTLEAFVRDNKGYEMTFPEGANQGEFERIKYSDLTYKTTGKKVLPDYQGPGFVYFRKGLENVNQVKSTQMSDLLDNTGFTRIEPEDAQSPEANAGFYISDVAKDLESLKPLATESPNTKIWPKPGTLIVPSRGACRDAIKLLARCSKSTTITAECTKNLWKNKVLAIQCGDKNFVSGAFGVGDEYNQISIDRGKYGLANLRDALSKGFDRSEEEKKPNPQFAMKESLRYKVSKILNEEYKRRNFIK